MRSGRPVVLLFVFAVSCATEREPSTSPAPIRSASAAPADLGFDKTVEPQCPEGISPDVGSFTWREGADMNVARTEVAAAALDGRIYVAGGLTRKGTSAAVEVYDPRTDRWSRAPDLPAPRHHAGLAAARGRLWLVGGYDEGGRASDDVWTWRPGAGSWTAGPRLPNPRGALAVGVVHDGLHAAGGATGFGGRSRLSAQHAYLAPGADGWTVLDPLPEARDHLAAAGSSLMRSAGGTAARGGELRVIGGRHLSLDSNESRVDRFVVDDVGRPAAGRWSAGEAMPRSRGGFAAVYRDVLLFVFGGEEPGGTIAPVDYFEIEDGVWCAAPPLPTPRHGLGAATIGNRVYVVGGGPTPGGSVSARNEILELGS